MTDKPAESAVEAELAGWRADAEIGAFKDERDSWMRACKKAEAELAIFHRHLGTPISGHFTDEAVADRLLEVEQLGREDGRGYQERELYEAKAELAAERGKRCGTCGYAEGAAVAGGKNELVDPGTAVYSCRNGVCWCREAPDMNPSWFGCSLHEPAEQGGKDE